VVGGKLALLAERLTMIILPSTVNTIVKGASNSQYKDITIGIKLNKIRDLHAL
jgi:hypothetical protein